MNIQSAVMGEPGAISRARVFRADGTVDVYYSKPNHRWWHLRSRAWYNQRLAAMKAEDRALLEANGGN